MEAAKRFGLPTLVAGAKEHIGALCHELIQEIADRYESGLKLLAKAELKPAMQEGWALGNFHQLLQHLWVMEQKEVEKLRLTSLQIVLANAADIMLKQHF